MCTDNTQRFSGSGQCQVYTCGDGVTVSGTSANLHFISDDPDATFTCRLNSKKLNSCENDLYKWTSFKSNVLYFLGTSPLQLSDLSQGENVLDITPVCLQAASGKRESITFTV